MDIRGRSVWHALGYKVFASALIASFAVGSIAMTAVAQDATPEASPVADESRPAHIHTGSCDEVGEVIQPLQNLTLPTGATIGHAEAVSAETSFTNVPLTLDAILAEDHIINVHMSAEEIDVYIACGEVGGALDANGALVIGLGELNNSGYRGIAFLSPAADGVSTDVSVFIASEDEGGS